MIRAKVPSNCTESICAGLIPPSYISMSRLSSRTPGLLSAMSIRDNLRLGRPGADDEAVRDAARKAQILSRIEKLPRGLDSVVGEDASLSGGERQRVCIARAVLADRPILVLDEATVSTDPENEARIQDALSEVAPVAGLCW